MFRMLRTAALAALVSLGAIGAGSAPAMAEGLYLGFNGSGGHVGIGFGHAPRWGAPGWSGHGPARHACTPARAVGKATRMGVRHARIVDVDRRVIKVHGRSHGHRVNLLFARAPNCPLIR